MRDEGQERRAAAARYLRALAVVMILMGQGLAVTTAVSAGSLSDWDVTLAETTMVGTAGLGLLFLAMAFYYDVSRPGRARARRKWPTVHRPGSDLQLPPPVGGGPNRVTRNGRN